MGEMVTLKEYAWKHNVHPDNVRQKINRGTIPAEKVGRDWMIDIDQPYSGKADGEIKLNDMPHFEIGKRYQIYYLTKNLTKKKFAVAECVKKIGRNPYGTNIYTFKVGNKNIDYDAERNLTVDVMELTKYFEECAFVRGSENWSIDQINSCKYIAIYAHDVIE